MADRELLSVVISSLMAGCGLFQSIAGQAADAQVKNIAQSSSESTPRSGLASQGDTGPAYLKSFPQCEEIPVGDSEACKREAALKCLVLPRYWDRQHCAEAIAPKYNTCLSPDYVNTCKSMTMGNCHEVFSKFSGELISRETKKLEPFLGQAIEMYKTRVASWQNFVKDPRAKLCVAHDSAHNYLVDNNCFGVFSVITECLTLGMPLEGRWLNVVAREKAEAQGLLDDAENSLKEKQPDDLSEITKKLAVKILTITSIKRAIEQDPGLKLDDSEIAPLLASLQQKHAALSELDARLSAQAVEAAPLPKANAHDAGLEAEILRVVKKAYPDLSYTGRVLLTDGSWSMQRHPATGVLTGRIREAAAATSESDGCFLRYYIMGQEHNGGKFESKVYIEGVGSSSIYSCKKLGGKRKVAKP